MDLEQNLREIAKDIRCDVLTCIGSLGVGHIGGCLSVVELLTVLYFEAMNIDPNEPKMAGRDRFICSKGHAGPAVYATLANRGYFDKKELLTLNRGGTNLPSHCDMNRTTGIDMTTGSLGQGFSCAVGVALGSKLEGDGATIYTLIGDGETQEGQIWEAAQFASHHKIDNIIAFTDWNGQQIDGTTEEVIGPDHLDQRWKAFGWNVVIAEDGNSIEDILAAIKLAEELQTIEPKPVMIMLKTVMGKGVDFMEGTCKWHGKAPKPEECEAALKQIPETLGDF